MYAIRNKRTKKWVYGTDYRYCPSRQRTADDRLLVYSDYDEALLDFKHRKCGKEYEIIEIEVRESNK